MIDTRELNLVIPNAPLILYAKNWIRFKRKHKENDTTDYIWDDMCKVVELCNYVPCKNPVLQVVMLFDQIVRYLQEMKEKYPELNIRISRQMTSVYQFLNDVYNQINISQITGARYDFDKAVINTVLSELSMVEIKPPMKIRRMIYDKSSKIRMGSHKEGLTYKHMQRDFDMTFGGCFLEKDKNDIGNL